MSSGSSADSFAGFTVAAGLTVRHLHALLGLDLWMVTCLDTASRSPRLSALLQEAGLVPPGQGDGEPPSSDRQVVVASAGNLAEVVGVGVDLDWATSFCSRMVANEGPAVAPDVSLVPAYLVPQTVSSGFGFGTVRAYAGVPLRWADGTIFGTVCGYGLSVTSSLDDAAQRHLELLENCSPSCWIRMNADTSGLKRSTRLARWPRRIHSPAWPIVEDGSPPWRVSRPGYFDTAAPSPSSPSTSTI